MVETPGERGVSVVRGVVQGVHPLGRRAVDTTTKKGLAFSFPNHPLWVRLFFVTIKVSAVS